MEPIRDLTKRLIANSFKELMATTPFEKITIKMVTDHANVIRPTFYNHFHDKYEVLEWFVEEEILAPAAQLYRDGQAQKAVHFILSGFYEDRVFYRKAFEIVGQNGFPQMLSEKVAAFVLGLEEQEPLMDDKNPVLTKQLAAGYYGSGLITIIQAVIKSDEQEAVAKYASAYAYLTSHTVFELHSS